MSASKPNDKKPKKSDRRAYKVTELPDEIVQSIKDQLEAMPPDSDETPSPRDTNSRSDKE